MHNGSSVTVPSTTDTAGTSNSTSQTTMNSTTTTYPQTNSAIFTYRSAALGGNAIRQRTIAETIQNNSLISTDRLKSNVSSSIRPTRQSMPTATLPSAFVSPPLIQRNNNQNTKLRVQQERLMNSRGTIWTKTFRTNNDFIILCL